MNYVKASKFPYRPFVCFELPEGTAFRQEDTIKVAAMLRSLACRKQNRDDFVNNSAMIPKSILPDT